MRYAGNGTGLQINVWTHGRLWTSACACRYNQKLVLYISEKETDRSVSKLNWSNVISFFQAQPRGLHLRLPDEDSYAPWGFLQILLFFLFYSGDIFAALSLKQTLSGQRPGKKKSTCCFSRRLGRRLIQLLSMLREQNSFVSLSANMWIAQYVHSYISFGY